MDADDAARIWMQKAINIAEYHDDGGVLQSHLQQKMMALKFGPEETEQR
jgi:hypothetical protein